MPKYRFHGPVPVKCAGRLWQPGDEAEASHEIHHPHFTQVKAKPKQEALPDANTDN